MRTDSMNNSQNRALNRYLKEIAKSNHLSFEEERDALMAISNGDMIAKERLITSNLKFVVAVARRYYCSKIALIDLINDGNIGLIRAIEKFNIEKEFRFLTFAHYYIRGSILASIYDNYSLVRIPRHQWLSHVDNNPTLLADCEKYGIYVTSELEDKFWEQNNDPFNQIYLSSDTNVIKELFIDAQDIIGGIDAQEREVKLNKLLITVISKLSEKEQYIIKATFGLGEDKIATYEILGLKYGVSRERIRIIRKKALAKLRKTLKHLDTDDLLND